MKETAMALGFFDGVHLGHAKILETAAEQASKLDIHSAACSFETHPRAFLSGCAPQLICGNEERRRLILSHGIEEVIFLPFDRGFADMPPRAFADMLKDKFGCVLAVCGESYRFGKNAAGRPCDLETFGIKTVMCENVLLDGRIVSSTLIRELISEGRVKEAGAALGRPFSLSGRVRHGRGIGRKLGSPTVNAETEKDIILPARGVYATRIYIGDNIFGSVTNVGTRPTVSDGKDVSVESFVFGLSGDVYGEQIKLEFIEKIRDEKRFDGRAELSRQIDRDKLSALRILSER